MSKVTSKLQVSLPKALAVQLGIRPGSELTWEVVGNTLRVLQAGPHVQSLDIGERLRLFDETTRRLKAMRGSRKVSGSAPQGRGWSREELYTRGGAR